jgi:hypothetical protein
MKIHPQFLLIVTSYSIRTGIRASYALAHYEMLLRRVSILMLVRIRTSTPERIAWAFDAREAGLQGRGVVVRFGTLRPRRCAEVALPWLAEGRLAVVPAREGGGGTGSRGRTPTGAVEATQPLSTRPARRIAGNVTVGRMVLLHRNRRKS